MQKYLIALLMAFASLATFAQNSTDPITIEKKWRTVFLQNGQTVSPRQLVDITSVNPDAYRVMKLAKSNHDASMMFGSLGVFFIAMPIGASVFSYDPNWAMAGIGAGLVAVAIPFSVKYTKQAKSAVSLYNGGLKATSQGSVVFNMAFSSNGLGLRMTF
jgi:hypothetical protein